MHAILPVVSPDLMRPIFAAFHGADFNCVMRVPRPQIEQLRAVTDAYQAVLGYSMAAPKILDANRGAVNFPGFGDGERRAKLQSWLLEKYGWKPLPRPVRALVAFRNSRVSDYEADTAQVFSALEAFGWDFNKDDHRIGSGFGKPGTPATDRVAQKSGERVKAKVSWQVCRDAGRVVPNWVRVGGTPGNPRSVPSHFSTLILSAELLLDDDRYRRKGYRALRQGLTELLGPMVSGQAPLTLSRPGASASETDWPGCALEFKLR
jgi:hypothetical protein